MNFLIFVPARANSIRLKNKNFKKIRNKPLIHFTINFIKKLRIKNILISTDSKKIKKYCKSQGFEMEYIRPSKISKSSTKMFNTVIHGVKWYEKNKKIQINSIILLQPTFPMRNINSLKKAINIYRNKKYESLTSISQIKVNPVSLLEFNSTNSWKFFNKKRKTFRIDGNFYICSKKFLMKYKKFSVENKTKLIESDVKYPIDIDTYYDFKIAKCLIEND